MLPSTMSFVLVAHYCIPKVSMLPFVEIIAHIGLHNCKETRQILDVLAMDNVSKNVTMI